MASMESTLFWNPMFNNWTRGSLAGKKTEKYIFPVKGTHPLVPLFRNRDPRPIYLPLTLKRLWYPNNIQCLQHVWMDFWSTWSFQQHILFSGHILYVVEFTIVFFSLLANIPTFSQHFLTPANYSLSLPPSPKVTINFLKHCFHYSILSVLSLPKPLLYTNLQYF